MVSDDGVNSYHHIQSLRNDNVDLPEENFLPSQCVVKVPVKPFFIIIIIIITI